MSAVKGQIRVMIDNEAQVVHPETEIGAVKDYENDVTRRISSNTVVHTSTYFTTQNPILKEGQYGYESDTNFQKLGDGSTAYNSLPYIGTPSTGMTIKVRNNSSANYAPIA